MQNILYTLAAIGAVLAGLQMYAVHTMNEPNLMAQGLGAALAMSYAVIPYVLARSVDGIRGKGD